ncbi:hypothetical protein MKZ38_004937 [Zalerion maritima]|uniref:2EXR domain-containing protein n=1 Tax=Zalerion maritima TaxID=339359 RepID=A0AAD5RLT0_9PEZI|nr:hypothetical protein MKZ38_004937 [Zalerion maritima]
MDTSRLDRFTLFFNLPAEIRLQIWQEACHERVVEVLYRPEEDKVIATTDQPAVLQVNRESRYEALKIYRKAFTTATRDAQIYFCPWRDTLYMPRHRDMGYDDAARDFRNYVLDTDDISSLAIDHVRPDIIRPWEPYNKFWLIQSFPNLREVVLVVGADPETRRNDTHAEIQFIDPVEHPDSVLRLLDDVKESFIHDAEFEDFGRQERELINCPLIAKAKITRDNTHMITCL